MACLEADWDRLVTFYAFPEAHCQHLRTSNVVESPFAACRLRTSAAKRFKKVASATAMLWRLLMVGQRRFRRLNAPALVGQVADGKQFVDGKPAADSSRKAAA